MTESGQHAGLNDFCILIDQERTHQVEEGWDAATDDQWTDPGWTLIVLKHLGRVADLVEQEAPDERIVHRLVIVAALCEAWFEAIVRGNTAFDLEECARGDS